MRNILSIFHQCFRNWVTLLGAILTTVSGLGLIISTLLEMMSARSNPYLSGVLIVSLPLSFLLGLALIPIGLYPQRRRIRSLPECGVGGDRRSRALILFIGLLTVINVLLLSIGGHKAVTYMDSPRFCGTSCHTQMQPEWTAYQRSAHSQVACVECHIGPGTPAFVEAKLQGLSQLFGTLTGKYQRPVSPAKVHGQRTGAACEACHNRSIFVGDRVRMYPHYKLDKENSPAFNVMLIHVGGRSSDPTDAPGGEPDKYSGIHSHLAKNRIIRYEYLDAQRTRIGKITVLQDGKLKAEYRRPNADPKEKPLGEQVMECIDCHNRPAHRFDGTARQAVERAIFEGRLDAKQPYLAKVVTEVLGQAEVARDGAEAYFKKAIPAAYASMAERPSAEAMDQAIRSVTQIYLRNVFPKMKVRFDTYPDLAGHHAEAGDAHVGCLRCHDGQHEAKLPNGKSKTMDKSCDLCHDTLATEKPPEKFEDTLKQVLGLPLD